MARTNTKNAALAPVEPVDPTDAMFDAVSAFLAANFPRSTAAAIVVNPAPGLPAVVIAVKHDGCVPAIIGCDDLVRVG